NMDKRDTIKVLLYYMLASDVYYRHTAGEFFARWKPVIDLLIANSNAK
ncbi:MAG: hypothetical protein GY940_20760, partial [bacterium]|nr:hypothetical protein [bacterium]